MAVDAAGLFAALSSHAASLGIFDVVNEHESANPPGNGITCGIWFVRLGPAMSSGLSSTSGVVTFMARVYKPDTLPQDSVDREILPAASELIATYAAHFTLGGLVRQVDLRGQTGTPLSAQAGWLPGEPVYRTVDITIPLIVNDLFPEAP